MNSHIHALKLGLEMMSTRPEEFSEGIWSLLELTVKRSEDMSNSWDQVKKELLVNK